MDQDGERLPIDLGARPDFHVTHVLPGSFEQPAGIGEVCAQKEAHVHMRRECIDVTERRVAHARRRMAIMQQFAHVVAALAHALEPRTRDRTKLTRLAFEPRVNVRVVLHASRKAQQLDSSTHSGHLLQPIVGVRPHVAAGEAG